MAEVKKYEVKFSNGTSTTMKLTAEHAKEYETNGAQVKALSAPKADAPAQTKKRKASNK